MILCGLVCALLPSPTQFTGEEIFARVMSKAKLNGWAKMPIGELVGKVGTELLGTPYVGFTLEGNVDVEVCTVNLSGLDCVTFFESSLGFARIITKGLSTTQALRDEVRFTRYRGGKLTDYTSRLHYTLDWMFDNQEKGVVVPVTDFLPEAKPFESGDAIAESLNRNCVPPRSIKRLSVPPLALVW